MYLHNWWKAAIARIDLPRANRKRLCLSRETLEGLQMTSKRYLSLHGILTYIHTYPYVALSFVELVDYLFDVPGVKYILSERLCQDPLESFFGKQRMRNGYGDNPTVQSFMKGTVSLRIQGSVATNPARANCRRGKKRNPLAPVDNTPIPKRKRK